jgi:hypothetical protein
LQRAVVAFGLLLLSASPSFATSISLQPTDLADTTPGEDLWQYTYTVAGGTFSAENGFMILFLAADYGHLSDPAPDTDPAPFVTTDAEWDLLLFDPDLPPSADGVLDSLALVSNPLNLTFSVNVVRLAAGAPSPQTFLLYHLVNDSVVFDGEGVTQLDPGSTAVPEPASVALISTGILLQLARARRRAKRKH